MPDAQHRALRDAELARQAAAAPARGVGRLFVQGLGEDRFDQLIADGARGAGARLIEQPAHARGDEAAAPLAHGLRGDAEPPCHFAVGAAVLTTEHDACPYRQCMARTALARPAAQLTLLLTAQPDRLQFRLTLHR